MSDTTTPTDPRLQWSAGIFCFTPRRQDAKPSADRHQKQSLTAENYELQAALNEVKTNPESTEESTVRFHSIRCGSGKEGAVSVAAVEIGEPTVIFDEIDTQP